MTLYEQVKAALRLGTKPEHCAAAFNVSVYSCKRIADMLRDQRAADIMFEEELQADQLARDLEARPQAEHR